MYVCVCTATTDRVLRSAWSQGEIRTVRDVARRFKAGTRCGMCRPAICMELDRLDGAAQTDAVS